MEGGAVDKRIIGAGVGIPLLALVMVIVVAVSGGRDEGVPPTSTPPVPEAPGPVAIDETWNEDLATTVAPLAGVLTDLASSVDAWSRGALDDAALAAVLERTEGVVDGVQAGAAHLPDHPQDSLAKPLVVQMATLYRTSVDAHRQAIDAGGGLGGQYDYLGRRLRILADRAFDRARERTSATVESDPDIELILPAEVPDWDRLEIAAGPPLEVGDPNRADELPRQRDRQRPSQPVEDWLDAVASLEVPTRAQIRKAFGDTGTLASLARGLVEAAEAMRTVPVPAGDRGRADRVALGWLIRADAARAAQLEVLAATSTGPDGAETLADRLLAISEDPVFDPMSGGRR